MNAQDISYISCPICFQRLRVEPSVKHRTYRAYHEGLEALSRRFAGFWKHIEGHVRQTIAPQYNAPRHVMENAVPHIVDELRRQYQADGAMRLTHGLIGAHLMNAYRHVVMRTDREKDRLARLAGGRRLRNVWTPEAYNRLQNEHYTEADTHIVDMCAVAECDLHKKTGPSQAPKKKAGLRAPQFGRKKKQKPRS